MYSLKTIHRINHLCKDCSLMTSWLLINWLLFFWSFYVCGWWVYFKASPVMTSSIFPADNKTRMPLCSVGLLPQPQINSAEASIVYPLWGSLQGFIRSHTGSQVDSLVPQTMSSLWNRQWQTGTGWPVHLLWGRRYGAGLYKHRL